MKRRGFYSSGTVFPPLSVRGALAAAIICLGCVIFSPGSAAGGVQSAGDWTATHFRLARRAQVLGHPHEAVREYELVLSRDPGFAEAYMNLGIVYHQERKYRKATKALEAAASLKPGLLGAQVFLGIDRYMLGDFLGALEPLRKAMTLKPTDRQAGVYLALTYVALGYPEKAAQQLRRTSEYFPDDVELDYDLGQAYLQGMKQSLASLQEAGEKSSSCHWALAIGAELKHDTVGAIEEYLKALALAPNTADLYWRLAVTARTAGIPDLAAAALERYKALNPERDPDSITLGQTAVEAGTDAAVVAENKRVFQRLWAALPPIDPKGSFPAIGDQFANQALRMRLAEPEGITLRGPVKSYLRGDYEESAQRLMARRTHGWVSAYLAAWAYLAASNEDAAEKVLEERLTAYFRLPSVALLRSELDSRLALRYLNRVLQKQPNSFFAKLIQAKTLAAANHYQQALTAYQQALKVNPSWIGVHSAIGRLYESQLHWAKAVREYKAELALDPDNAMALAELGHASTEVHDPDQAIRVLTGLLELYPKDGRAYADLGKAWVMEGVPDKAIQAYERALRLDPSQNSLHYRLFQLYKQMGRTAQAQSHLAAFKAGEASKTERNRKAARSLM